MQINFYDLHKLTTKIGLIILLSIIFGSMFYNFFPDESNWFILQKHVKNEITLNNMIIYSLFNFTTLGLGDIMPKSIYTRILSGCQAVIAYFILLY